MATAAVAQRAEPGVSKQAFQYPVRNNYFSKANPFSTKFFDAKKAFFALPKISFTASSSSSAPTNKISLQDILKMLDEELRRRMGGGGGGSARSKTPYVPYSFLMMNYMRDLMQNAMKMLLLQNPAGNAAAQSLPQAQNTFSFKNSVQNLLASLKQFFSPAALARMQLNPQKLAQQVLGSVAKMAQMLSNSFMNLGVLAANILANKLFKTPRDEEEESLEVKFDNLKETLESFGRDFLKIFQTDSDSGDNNASSFYAHIQNFSDQLSKLVASFGNTKLKVKNLRAT